MTYVQDPRPNHYSDPPEYTNLVLAPIGWRVGHGQDKTYYTALVGWAIQTTTGSYVPMVCLDDGKELTSAMDEFGDQFICVLAPGEE